MGSTHHRPASAQDEEPCHQEVRRRIAHCAHQAWEVDVEACRRAKITAAEVAFKLRREGVYHVRDVKRAVFEQNGELIIVLRGEENPKYPIITDGIVQTSVLDDVDKTEEWLTDELQRAGYNSAAEIFLAEYENGELKLIPFVRASQAE